MVNGLAFVLMVSQYSVFLLGILVIWNCSIFEFMIDSISSLSMCFACFSYAVFIALFITVNSFMCYHLDYNVCIVFGLDGWLHQCSFCRFCIVSICGFGVSMLVSACVL